MLHAPLACPTIAKSRWARARKLLVAAVCVTGFSASSLANPAPETVPPPAGSTGEVPAVAAEPVSPPEVEHSPAVSSALARLGDAGFVGRFAKDDVTAALQFYRARKDPVWTLPAGLTDGAKAMANEIANAGQWGLDARAFPLPSVSASFADADDQGAAEAQLTLAALTYARHAKGGRTRPLSISQMIDLTPPVRDPNQVLKDLETRSDRAAYLRDLHPKHVQFQRLRAELLKRLGPVEPPKPVDEALFVQLPETGATIKPGSLHPDIALLRKRLKQPAIFAGQQMLYDEKLAEAVKAFQTDKGLKANGQINRRTRTGLNREAAGRREDDNPRDMQRVIVNMERWRWMPDDLGASYVINNVPEYITRMYKGDQLIFKEKIIVGLPEWPTPAFSAEMKTIVFNPSWGVPDGIKAKELKPRLQRAGGSGFFDQLFGGGGGAAVIRAYGFTPYRNGRPIDPNSVDWSTADLRQYSFIQPPGAQNPLGFVKFMFPNTHDVYMHDTTQRHLFAQSRRPFSHGCIRVNNPMRFAEVLLEQDKGWSAERAAAARRSSETIELNNHIWVHNVYLTMWIEDDGKVANFGDVYGLDSRVSKAIGGSSIQSIQSPADDVETASIADDEGEPEPQPGKKKQGGTVQKKPAKQVTMPGSFSESMSGLIAN